MPVYNKRGILLLPKVIVLNPKDGMCTVLFLFACSAISDAVFAPFILAQNGEVGIYLVDL